MRSKRQHMTFAVGLAVLGLATLAGAQPLNRNLSAYCIFAQEQLSLKNIKIDSACNVGVNCAQPTPHSACGRADFDNPMFATGSQLVSDAVTFNRPGGILWQLFTNHPFNTANVTINDPPVTTFTPPIIPGTCDPGCVPKPDAIATFCKLPSPFPACCPASPITVPSGATLDLAPGCYGLIKVANGGTLNLSAGTYDICDFAAAQHTVITGSGTVINLADSGSFAVGNDSMFGKQQCGDFTVLIEGHGNFSLGRRVQFAGQVCGPDATLSLGHSTRLVGQFIGLEVFGNHDDSLSACKPPGECTCFDTFTPTKASVGQTITITSHCDLTNATGVKICGIPTPIVTQSQSTLTVLVPVGASGSCAVEVDSAPGSFVGNTQLTVM